MNFGMQIKIQLFIVVLSNKYKFNTNKSGHLRKIPRLIYL